MPLTSHLDNGSLSNLGTWLIQSPRLGAGRDGGEPSGTCLPLQVGSNIGRGIRCIGSTPGYLDAQRSLEPTVLRAPQEGHGLCVCWTWSPGAHVWPYSLIAAIGVQGAVGHPLGGALTPDGPLLFEVVSSPRDEVVCSNTGKQAQRGKVTCPKSHSMSGSQRELHHFCFYLFICLILLLYPWRMEVSRLRTESEPQL